MSGDGGRRPGRLEMDLQVGACFRLFRADRLYEVVGFLPGRSGRPDARVRLRRVGTYNNPLPDPNRPSPVPHGEARRSVERWILRELHRGGWPWP